MSDAEIVLEDVRYADTVIVGEVANYKVLTPEGKKPGYIWDYARFDVIVHEVLKGEAGQTLAVTWDNSTFGEPQDLPTGQYLLAVRSPASTNIPPLRGPSATIFPRPEASSPVLLQAPCASPFLFKSESEEATALRKILQRAEK